MLLVISGGGGVNDQLGQFLTDNGLGHLKESFVEQEVEVRQLVGMSDQNLMELRGENYRCQNEDKVSCNKLGATGGKWNLSCVL